MTTPNGRIPLLAAVDDWDTDRAQPDSEVITAERAILGSAIQTSDLAAEALAALQPQDFSRNTHRVVFEAVQHLADSGQPVEPASVMTELARAGHLFRIGDKDMGSGGAYLHTLMGLAGDIGYHSPIVVAEARRNAIRLALKSAEGILDTPGWDLDTHPDMIRKLIEDATAFAGTTALRPNSETVYEVLNALEQAEDPGLPTGYPDLDDAIGGLRPKELTVVGARPGQGKSLIGLCIADHVGTNLGLPVLFASLEMTEEQLTQRRIAATAKVPLTRIVRHEVTDDEWGLIQRVMDRLTTTQLHVDDKPRVSFAHIRGRLRAMARTGQEARLLVVDYLGFMAEPRNESRQQAIAELARQAHDVAREFGIPVVLLAQLNRLVDSRSDKSPLLSDLRESGEIEQSADIVLLLHREDYYEPESPRAGEIDVLVRKNRQGPLCTVTLCFQGQYGRIVSLGPDRERDNANWTPSSSVDGAK